VHALLEVPARLAARTCRRALVILDEFQALTHLPGLDGVSFAATSSTTKR
jgi:hypothetical protein